MKPEKNKAAQEMARLSHAVITEKRRENARTNGKKGGRPKNVKPEPIKIEMTAEDFAKYERLGSPVYVGIGDPSGVVGWIRLGPITPKSIPP